jgi:hypothetical protein
MLHIEKGSPDRMVVSPREGEASILGLQASMSCPGVIARSGIGHHRGLSPPSRCGVADVAVPVVTALSAWWWFTNCPARCGLAVAFVIVSYSPGGVVATVQEHVAAPRSSIAFAGLDVDGLEPRL